MPKIIISPNDDGSLCITLPADCEIPVYQIARKDVPAGKPFLIIEATDLPEDQTYIAAWTADFSTPDGVGIGPDAWFAEQENH